MERERGFRLRIKASFGGKNDKQGWPVVEDTLSKGDTYGISAANVNEKLMRIRRPHREISKEDFKLALPSNTLIQNKDSSFT